MNAGHVSRNVALREVLIFDDDSFFRVLRVRPKSEFIETTVVSRYRFLHDAEKKPTAQQSMTGKGSIAHVILLGSCHFELNCITSKLHK